MTSPIKVAILLPSMQVGGAERLVLEELSYLAMDKRFSFEIHLVYEKGPLFGKLSSLGLPVYAWNTRHVALDACKTYLDIILHLRRTNCDILHSHLLDHVGPYIGRLSGTRVVATVHNDIRYSFLKRFSLARSHLVLGCGVQVSRNIRGFIREKKVRQLPNAISKSWEICAHRGDFLERFGVRSDSFVVASLGRLSVQKGFDVLILAFKEVVRAFPKAVLLIGGDGSEKNKLEELVISLALEGHVKLLGNLDDVHALLEACDLYVNSSRWEGLPITLLEAMVHRLPIIATNVGGNVEVIQDGVTGVLVPSEDNVALQSAIMNVMSDDSLRHKIRSEAHKLFLSDFTIDKHCEKLADFYLEITGSSV